MPATFFKRRGYGVSIATVHRIDKCWNYPGLVNVAVVRGVKEGHELNDRRRRPVVKVDVRVVIATGTGDALHDMGIVGRRRRVLNGAWRVVRSVRSPNRHQLNDHSALHPDLAALCGVFGEKNRSGRICHLEVVVPVWEPCSSLRSMRSGATIQVDVYLAVVMHVLVDDFTICRRGKDGTRQRGGDTTNYHEAHYDGDCDDGDHKYGNDACEEPHLYLLAR